MEISCLLLPSDGKQSACSVGDPGLIPGQKDLLEEEMAIHSNILGWRIPWTEEPGGLQSMGSKKVGHKQLSTRACPES